ncbi:MAG TPA: 1,4-dihydroxy-6-naphthoate synthase [Bacteroidales bacterium]|nr:MAG: 1,4-dihydroxy-6-naphthoate synthase [Bacteroidetes bacterium GWF2_33_38]OFY91588.1 MAG: 1,4-dihydroxy-6-naphthoate synthase [Bacteroidetes bacterium RIFOXYA2_FULL_33_7]HBF88575.1 1,4-dihydroxy-6-naphthoate synthase [Bacteroidales bacterium]
METIRIGISSCPNDTFAFEAIYNRRINLKGYKFEFIISDIEELNKQAFIGEIDVTKISFHAFAHLSEKYQILNSGNAIGYKNGPLLISKYKIYPDEIKNVHVAIPGKNTTANLLLSVLYPEITNKTEYLFSDIEEVVLSKEVDAGLIIHENRFTYEKKGLKKIVDLGEEWEKRTKKMIPLGGIIIKRTLPEKIKNDINRLIFESISFAHKNPKIVHSFVKQHAQEMNDEVMKKHIDLYVNKYTLELQDEGRKAIEYLLDLAKERNLVAEIHKPLFVLP